MKPFTIATAAVLLTLATVLTTAAACLPSSSDAATAPTATPTVYLLTGKDAGGSITDADFQQLRQEAEQEQERGKPGNSPRGLPISSPAPLTTLSRSRRLS